MSSMDERAVRRSTRLRSNLNVENTPNLLTTNASDNEREDGIVERIADDFYNSGDAEMSEAAEDDIEITNFVEGNDVQIIEIVGAQQQTQPQNLNVDNEIEIVAEHTPPPMPVVTGSIMRSPENNMKLAAGVASQTTPGLVKNGGGNGQPVKEALNDSMDEDQSCPICFDIWTNTGSHRLASLPCGHLFGRSCIERWLKEPRNKFCPQCKTSAKRKDIRNIFAKSLKALDTSEQERIKKALLEEKYKRSQAEENEAKAVLQYQLLKAEMDRLRKDVSEQETRYSNMAATAGSSRSEPLSGQATASTKSTGALNVARNRSTTTTRTRNFVSPSHVAVETFGKTYQSQRVLQIAQKDARVLAYDKTHMVMIASKPSPNQLFKGHGVLKVSSLDNRSSEYLSIHQNTIRDAKFNPSGDRLLLTASTDKTLKLTSVLSNSCVQTYTCPNPVWACAWNEANTNYVYAGVMNGSCYVFDIRQTNEEVAICRPRVGVARPIVSLAYVPPGDENSVLRCEGVLVGTLQGGWFIHKTAESFIDHQLILPEGSCSGLVFDDKNRYCMLSQRPGKKSPKIIHNIFQLVGDCSDNNPIHANIVQRCFGGNRSLSLTRSTLFACPEKSSQVMVASGDEASSSVVVWDGGNGKELQKLTCSGTIFDVLSFQAYESNFIASLTEQKLSFYQWL